MISTDEVEDVPAKVKAVTGGKLAYAVRRFTAVHAVPSCHCCPAACTLPSARCTVSLGALLQQLHALHGVAGI